MPYFFHGVLIYVVIRRDYLMGHMTWSPLSTLSPCFSHIGKVVKTYKHNKDFAIPVQQVNDDFSSCEYIVNVFISELTVDIL